MLLMKGCCRARNINKTKVRQGETPFGQFMHYSNISFLLPTALASVNTPMLQDLDLSYVTGFSDGALYKILSAPRDSRPGETYVLFSSVVPINLLKFCIN